MAKLVAAKKTVARTKSEFHGEVLRTLELWRINLEEDIAVAAKVKGYTRQLSRLIRAINETQKTALNHYAAIVDVKIALDIALYDVRLPSDARDGIVEGLETSFQKLKQLLEIQRELDEMDRLKE